jgi:hypothetical protein
MPLPPPGACVACGVGTAFAVFFGAGDPAAAEAVGDGDAAGLAAVVAVSAADFFRGFFAGVVAAEGVGVAC